MAVNGIFCFREFHLSAMILMGHAENMIKRQWKQNGWLKAWTPKTDNAICGLMADSRLRACIRLM
ncbi:hypothetical protein ACU52_00685 [Xylanibacter rarus]|uniref:Uncharacterized protein n=1 Tax=Xylanibacter rarus TaxID=1676614 RepID=A0A8E1R198_9BACT|nr:hypothetical protein ACU52_00685 [Xylanibacter rarus]